MSLLDTPWGANYQPIWNTFKLIISPQKPYNSIYVQGLNPQKEIEKGVIGHLNTNYQSVTAKLLENGISFLKVVRLKAHHFGGVWWLH